jgi:type III restriction enzyme
MVSRPDETLRATAYEKLLPPLVAAIRQEVYDWRARNYAGTSPTSRTLLDWWFNSDHLTENADGSLSPVRYDFAQREAVETAIWLHATSVSRTSYLCHPATNHKLAPPRPAIPVSPAGTLDSP